MKAFRKILPENNPGVLVDRYMEEYVYIAAFSLEESPQSIKRRMKLMCDTFTGYLEQHGKRYKLLIGKTYLGIEGIKKSYQELKQAMKEINLLNHDEVVFVESLCKPNLGIALFEKTKLLEQYLEGCKKNELFRLIEDIVLEIENKHHITVNQMKSVIMEVYFSINKILKRFGNSSQDAGMDRYFDIESINLFFDTGRLKALLNDICNKAIEDILSKKDDESQNIIYQILEYVNENYCEDIKLSVLCQNYYFNLEYFSRLFKKEVGVNFSEYLKELRMKKAGELLKKGNVKVADIAALTGYNDEHYFSRVFKEYYRCTPSQYQKMKTGQIK